MIKNNSQNANLKHDNYYTYWFHWFMALYPSNGILYISGGGASDNAIGSLTWTAQNQISWYTGVNANSQLNQSNLNYIWYCVG